MPAKQFRPAYGVLLYGAVMALGSAVMTVVTFPLGVTTVVITVLSLVLLAAIGVVATTCVTVSDNVLEHRIAGRRRTWNLPETRVEFAELTGQLGQWRMVLRGPRGTASVPLIGYLPGKVRAIRAAIPTA